VLEPADPELQATVDELRTYVERARGLEFQRDVPVHALEDQSFEELVDAVFALTFDEVATTAAYYEALGLIPAGTAEVYAQLLREQYRSILGFYAPEVELLVVRAGESDGLVRSVIVHELVHALDDQWFGMERPEYESDPTTELGTSFPMVLEGDATRIQNQWIQEQPPEVQAEAGQVAGDAVGRPTDLDSFLDFDFLAPYGIGTSFVSGVAATGGERLVDAVLIDPPETTEQVIFPEVFDRREGRVRVPRPPTGGAIVDEGVVGAFFWTGLLTLGDAAVTDAVADAAVRGWGGDWQVTWNERGVTCTRTDVVGDTPTDTAELLSALTTWVVSRPNVTVRDVDGRVRMEVCYQVPPSPASSA
jgi:hypothetical protein